MKPQRPADAQAEFVRTAGDDQRRGRVVTLVYLYGPSSESGKTGIFPGELLQSCLVVSDSFNHALHTRGPRVGWYEQHLSWLARDGGRAF